jgi:pimeloyl-ACP methyl ester carboxylesterase
MTRRLLILSITALLSGACGDPPPAIEAPAMHRIDTVSSGDGAAIVYEVHGDSAGRSTVVLVHCWSCDRSYWAPQVEDLSRDHRVVAIDLAGHGASTAGSRGDFTTAAFGRDVAAVVQDLAADRVALVGHSMGGGVVIEAARLLPGRVRGVVWLDAFHRFGSPSSEAELDEFFAPFMADFAVQTRAFVRELFPPTADSVLVGEVAMDMSAAPPAVAMSAIRRAFEYEAEVTAALDDLKLPVIAINADLFPTDTASLQQHGVEVMTMTGVGHFLQLEDPAQLNAMLRTALKRLPL